MSRRWTFGQKVGAGFAASVVLSLAITVVALLALSQVVAGKDRVIDVNAKILVDAQKVETALERKGAAVRGLLLTGEAKYVETLAAARAQMETQLADLKTNVYTDEGRRMVEDMREAELAHQRATDDLVAAKRGGGSFEATAKAYEEKVIPRRDALDKIVLAFVERQERLLKGAELAATETARSATRLVLAIAVLAILLALLTAAFLTRSLAREIGSAVSHVQSSSSELQAAANQQATGAKEQATAMNEITTTISELLVTSRQIAESAQRVSEIANDTTAAARAGDQTVQRTRETIAGIKRQVDIVVTHMLDLGKKSQQIGGVLEIINELAEQTNILAINASIEAAGAGESGKRFGVVAEEIRKLADRVTGSTKEIRLLIEDIRASVNATVMATEGGSKAVDAGTRQFGDVAQVFVQIAGLVGTTTEAAREIVLSTKQQTTAVEQVKAAIADVAQATKEMEASSGQTLQTSSQLATLSRGLGQLVRAQATRA